MQHFIAKILYQIKVSNGKQQQYEEKFIYIQAQSAEQAYFMANNIALRHEDEYINANKNNVKWQLIGITYLQHIPQFENGAELFSEIKENIYPERYLFLSEQISNLKYKYFNTLAIH